ncbi:hypothetical protein AAULR_26126 [Lacticaseibacillus rhamnosus MTCC 5462]|nr:hypothetical protein AAULR_26126 [Lacticaseibacillus rhamnosus MTCC 5462]
MVQQNLFDATQKKVGADWYGSHGMWRGLSCK